MQKLERKSKLKILDEFKSKKDLKGYLKTLSISKLTEIYYLQSCEINWIRKLILNSINDGNNSLDSKE